MHRFAANELGVPASSFEGIYTIPPLDTMVPGTGDRTIAFSDVSPLNSLTVPVGSIIEVGTNHGVATGFANGTIDITILSATNDWVTNEAALELLTPGYTFTTTHERTVGNQVLTGNIVTDSTLGVNAMGQLGVHTNTIDDVTQDFSVGVSLADASFTFDSVDLSATNDTEITFANRSAANAFWMGLGRADAEMSGSSNSVLFNNNRSTEYTLTIGTNTATLNAVTATFPANPSTVITFDSNLGFGSIGSSGTIVVNRPVVNFETGTRPLNLSGDAPVTINDINISRDGDVVTFTNPNPLQFGTPGTAGNVVVDWAQASSTEPIPAGRLGLTLGQVYTIDVTNEDDTVTVHDASDNDTGIPLALLRFTPTQNSGQWQQGDIAVITNSIDPNNVTSLGTFLYTGIQNAPVVISTTTASSAGHLDSLMIPLFQQEHLKRIAHSI